MSLKSCYIGRMARGQGPKLVIDVGHDLKRKLHGKLALEGRTVKDWITERIQSYLGVEQLSLYPPQPAENMNSENGSPRPSLQSHAAGADNGIQRDIARRHPEVPFQRKRLSAAARGRSKSR